MYDIVCGMLLYVKNSLEKFISVPVCERGIMTSDLKLPVSFYVWCKPGLWIRIDFNPDLDKASTVIEFGSNADTDPTT
jgi:hypothetical protein